MKENGKGAKELGSRIRYARKKSGLNQEKLAELLEMTTSSVGSYEVGKSYPSVEVLTKIGLVLNVSFDWLLKGEGESEYQLETVSSKPADQGAFGEEVESKMLREENQQLKKEKAELSSQLNNCLEIIRNLSLGKGKVAENIAAVAQQVTGSVTYQPGAAQKLARC